MSEEVRICRSCWEEDCVCDYEQYVELDEGIADIIISLNLKGYKTLYCCEGHIEPEHNCKNGNIMSIYVSFHKKYESLPEGFSYPRGKKHTSFYHNVLYKYKDGKLLARINGKYIPYDLEEDRKLHIQYLREWTDSLPTVDKKLHPECYSDYLVTGQPQKSNLGYELSDYMTYTVVIDEDDYSEMSERIIGFSGKIMDVQEYDGKLKVRYIARGDLFGG